MGSVLKALFSVTLKLTAIVGFQIRTTDCNLQFQIKRIKNGFGG